MLGEHRTNGHRDCAVDLPTDERNDKKFEVGSQGWPNLAGTIFTFQNSPEGHNKVATLLHL